MAEDNEKFTTEEMQWILADAEAVQKANARKAFWTTMFGIATIGLAGIIVILDRSPWHWIGVASLALLTMGLAASKGYTVGGES